MPEQAKRIILVISDDPKLIAAIEKAVGERYQIQSISFSEKKIHKVLIETQPTVVIIDAVMPQLSGVELSLRVRRWAPEIPILILSTWETAENMVRGFDSSSDTYLGKPMTSQEMRTRIENIISRA